MPYRPPPMDGNYLSNPQVRPTDVLGNPYTPQWSEMTQGYVDPRAQYKQGRKDKYDTMTGYYDDIGQGFSSQTGYDIYQDRRNALGNTAFEDLDYNQKAGLYGAWKGDKHSLTTGKQDRFRHGLGRAVQGVVLGGMAGAAGVAMLGGGATAGAGGAGSSGAGAGAGVSDMGAIGAEIAAGGGGGTAAGAGAGIGAGVSDMGAVGSEIAAQGGGAGAGGAGSTGMGYQDWMALGGDAIDMYGQYQAGEAQQDANAAAARRAEAAGAYGQAAYGPYSQAGGNALRGLEGMGGYDPTTDPQYQRELAEMSRVMNDRSASLGMSDSSADLLSRAAGTTDLYGRSYGREYNRLGDLLQVGQWGTTGDVNAQLGMANTMGNLDLRGGEIRGNQLAGAYGGAGDLLAAPAQYQQNQQVMNYLASQNRGY